MNVTASTIAHIRLCHVYGGAERYVLDLSEQLTARGYRSLILTPPDSPLAPKVQHVHGMLLSLPVRSGDLNLLTVLRVSRILRRQDIELVNMHDGTLPCCLGTHLAGIPVVATVHGFRRKWAFQTADHLIAVSDAVRDHFVKMGFPSHRITVVRNGTDTRYFTVGDRRAARAQLGIDPESFVFSTTSRLTQKKGINLLLEAFAQLTFTRPTTLIIAGSGPQEVELRMLAERLGISNRVCFLGFQADVRPVMTAADCHVLPSLIEPLGLAVLEAMACGRPCIATRSGGPAEVITDRTTGLLVDPGSISQLADALTFAATTPGWTDEAGLAARVSVEQSYSLQAQVDGVEAVYQHVLNQHKKPYFSISHKPFDGKIRI
ncbi:MAG TPA: glycosyltransferase family 4 protein [Armatimonadota bacterium]|nr:glycosyltransferase family 4 protein [Armatimonadota bacterium]